MELVGDLGQQRLEAVPDHLRLAAVEVPKIGRAGVG
jgi:hypothetical protein